MVKWTASTLPDIDVTLSSDSQPLQPWPEYLQASWLRCAHQTSSHLWHPPHSAKGQTLHSLRRLRWRRLCRVCPSALWGGRQRWLLV